MAEYILHVGLPLDHPAIPVEEREKIRKRLSELKDRMTRAGYRYEIAHAAPETGLEDFRRQLNLQAPDGVLIGGGVAGDPAMSQFRDQIIDATREVAPEAKVMLFSHQEDVQSMVQRAFAPASDTAD